MSRKSLPAPGWRDRREVSLAVVREYQSEIAALREQPYPRAAGMTIHLMLAMLIVGLVFTYVARIDRVVTSMQGALAPADPPVVYKWFQRDGIRH